jgi:hypothetical protein
MITNQIGIFLRHARPFLITVRILRFFRFARSKTIKGRRRHDRTSAPAFRADNENRCRVQDGAIIESLLEIAIGESE